MQPAGEGDRGYGRFELIESAFEKVIARFDKLEMFRLGEFRKCGFQFPCRAVLIDRRSARNTWECRAGGKIIEVATLRGKTDGNYSPGQRRRQ